MKTKEKSVVDSIGGEYALAEICGAFNALSKQIESNIKILSIQLSENLETKHNMYMLKYEIEELRKLSYKLKMNYQNYSYKTKL